MLRQEAEKVCEVLESWMPVGDEQRVVAGIYKKFLQHIGAGDLPYGVSLGYILHVQCPSDLHHHCVGGRKVPYVLPTEDITTVASQGNNRHTKTCQTLCKHAVQAHCARPRGRWQTLSKNSFNLQGVNGLKELCKRLNLWQDPEVDLCGLSVRSNLSIKTKNEQLLQTFPEFASCVRVSGATPFYDNMAIVENMELQMLRDLPVGDMVFFPFVPVGQPPT